MNVQGTVEQISQRPAGRGTAYNIKVDGNWYGCGFQPPACSEGDTVSFAVKYNGKYANVDGAVQVVQAGGGAAPQPQQAPNKPQAQPAQGGNSRDQYWKDKEERDIANQKIIQYQSSRNAAIELVRVAVENDAVSLGTKKSDKLDTMMALVDEITDKFDKDAVDMRDYGYRTGAYHSDDQDNKAEEHFGA